MICREDSCDKILVFSEKRSKLSLLNPQEVNCTKIKVDGCELPEMSIKKCDYMLLPSHEPTEYYIELKGQHIGQAIKQIESTLKILSANPKKSPKKAYIICAKTPMDSSELRLHIKKFKKEYNLVLVVKSSPYTDKI